MTIATATSRVDYIGNGATSVYDYTFRILEASHLVVTVRDLDLAETVLALNTDYTVTGVGADGGGTVTLLDGALTTDFLLAIRRVVPLTQATDIRNQGPFFPEVHEDEFDLLACADQQQQEVLDRTLRLPDTEAGDAASRTLPAVEDRASKFLAFDSSGNPVASSGSTDNPAPITAYIETLLDDANEAAARVTLGGLTKVVATKAALKALAGTNLTGTVLMQGYYAAGDHGGGLFVWDGADASGDNGGTVLAPDAGGVGRWHRLLHDEGPINVRWFGAVGDGASNDTTFIQAAIDFSLANENRPVYLPPGRYLVGSALTVAGGTMLLGAAGAGRLSTAGGTFLLISHAGNGLSFDPTGGIDNRALGGGARDLTILKDTGMAGGTAIDVTAVSDIRRHGDMTFSNVVIARTGTGMWARGIDIDGTACVTAGDEGIRGLSFTGVRIRDCSVSNEYVVLNQVANVSGSGLQVEAGDGTGTAGATLFGICANVNLGVNVIGNLIVDAAAVVTALMLTGRVSTLTVNPTTATGAALLTGTASTVNKSQAFRIVNGFSKGELILHKTASAANVTGDSTEYFVSWDAALTDSGFDVTPPLDTVDVKEAGTYLAVLQVKIENVTTAMTEAETVIERLDSGSVSQHRWIAQSRPNEGAVDSTVTLQITALLDCAYADKIRGSVKLSNGALTADVFGGADPDVATFLSLKRIA